MATINKIGYDSSNFVTKDEGQVFFPVTVDSAVYFQSQKTLHDMLTNSYNENNQYRYDNGIYSWLEHLESKFADYATDASLSSLDSRITANANTISVLRSDIQNYITGLRNNENLLEQRIYEKVGRLTNFQFDNVPTQGSTNLLTSGAVYSAIAKELRRNLNDGIKKVTDLGEYKGYDGEVVLYIGDDDGVYESGKMYIYRETVDGDIDSATCGDNYDSITISGTWEELGNGCGCDCDLSNYYTMVEVDRLLANLPVNDTKYYGDGTTTTINDQNVISAIIPQYRGDGTTVNIDANNVISAVSKNVDLSNYYNKEAIDRIVQEIYNNMPQYEQGDNIKIVSKRISAVLPQQSETDLSNYYTIQQIDLMLRGLNNTGYYGSDTIDISPTNVISLKPMVIPHYSVVSGSSNVHVTPSTMSNGSSGIQYSISVDRPNIPSQANDGTLTIRQGSNEWTFSADSWQDVTVELAEGGSGEGTQGPKGDKGDPGITPHIDSTTGNWFIGDQDTGVHAQGPQGPAGSGSGGGASVGTLSTTSTSALTTSSSESFSGSISLHKVSKTGSFDDLNNKPITHTLKLRVNGNDITNGTMSVYASADKTIDIPVPKIVFLGVGESLPANPDSNTLYLSNAAL